MNLTTASGASRNIPLQDLVGLLRVEADHRLDVIVGSGALRAEGARLVLDGTEPQLGPAGVTMTAGSYTVNDVALGQLADKLAIPGAYLRRLHEVHPDLFDANVNGWLARTDRRFLVRAHRTPTPGTGLDALPGYGFPPASQTAATQLAARVPGDGTVRAVLSDRYSRIDNLDVLIAALAGIRDSGAAVDVDGCDLTDRRMYVRVVAPGVRVQAPALLANYRSPFTGQAGRDLPIVWAGFVLSNSEVGAGAFTLRPRLVAQVCRNGMVMPVDGMRRTHLGARHDGDDGVVTWSQETTARTLDLITSRTKDAVAAYLDGDYVARMVRDLETVAGTPVRDPDTTLKVIGQRLRFTESQQSDVLAHFIAGADLTAGGVMHAVTSLAQTITDADAAHELEAVAVQAMHLAAAASTR